MKTFKINHKTNLIIKKMALSNWLTRDEWNACYFLGMKRAMDGEDINNFGAQMRAGISELHKAGYNFTGIESYESGGYEKVTQCCDSNETVLAEMIGGYGGFDPLARAKEILEWEDNPIEEWGWLEELIENTEKEQ